MRGNIEGTNETHVKVTDRENSLKRSKKQKLKESWTNLKKERYSPKETAVRI